MPSQPFNYALMKLLCRELQERILDFKIVDCLPNDPRRFFLILQGKQRQEALFFCFTPPFLRFHLIQTSSIPPHRSSHPLLSFLKDAILKNVSLLQNDRILQLTFQTTQGERLFIGEFFSKHPNYYLIDPERTILFSLHPHQRPYYQLPSTPSFISSESSPWNSHQEVENGYAELEKQWNFTKEKEALRSLFAKQLKKVLRKERELLENLKACANWPKVKHEGELIKFHFATIQRGASSITVQDWETDQAYRIELDPSKTIQEVMADRFHRAKKMESGITHLKHYLERVRKEVHQVEQEIKQLDLLKTAEELASFKKNVSCSISKPQRTTSDISPSISFYREYRSAKGIKILVGKNAKANERLSFQIANGRDWWLHTKGCSGSHVIIRMEKKDELPDPETLKDAMQLALYHSKARVQGEGEICFTQRKYVSRLGKEKAGRVQISKHETAWIRFDPARYLALKERLFEDRRY